jgi:hypothetical protein
LWPTSSRSLLISPRTKASDWPRSWMPWAPHWDPTQIFTDEAEAHRMLYAHLDSGQQAVYDLLIADGVLPESLEVLR